MGDPKKHRKKYSTPSHPWQAARIEEEKQLTKEYGFRNKKEIWKMTSFLRGATGQAKKLVTLSGEQADKERELLLARLKRYGLLTADATLEAILSINLRDVLERRLQTQLYKQRMANSVNQARQFIVHGHVTVDNKKITSPSYLVPLNEEAKISFTNKSALNNEEHPERAAARIHDAKLAKEKIVEKAKADAEAKNPRRRQQRPRREAPRAPVKK